jgi:hypothetical protein
MVGYRSYGLLLLNDILRQKRNRRARIFQDERQRCMLRTLKSIKGQSETRLALKIRWVAGRPILPWRLKAWVMVVTHSRRVNSQHYLEVNAAPWGTVPRFAVGHDGIESCSIFSDGMRSC